MGYCTWIINARKQLHSEEGKRRGFLISGSKGEDLTNHLQSDTDYLFFQDDFCRIFETEDKTVETKDPARYTFKVEIGWSPPGYCILLLSSRPTQPIRMYSIERSLSLIDKGVICLNPSNFLNCLSKAYRAGGTATKPRAGPSLPSTYKGYLEDDQVLTFSCPCSAELDDWYKRPRHHDWPSKSLQLDVISTPANVVAVGSKDGIFTNMEWRICFNRAELKLIHSLNPTQTKVYVVLKMILKDYLKPKNKEITSYVMKNIVLWMCEKNPSSLFTPSTLLSWIYEGLQTLRRHIESGYLPYYMIPARNLLDGKFLEDTIKTSFLDKLTKLTESGVCLVHVCETIKFGLELYSDGLLENYGWKRNIVEVSLFSERKPESVRIRFELLRLSGVVPFPSGIDLLPDLETLKARGYTDDEIHKVIWYRAGLFFNPDRAADYAQFVESYALSLR